MKATLTQPKQRPTYAKAKPSKPPAAPNSPNQATEQQCVESPGCAFLAPLQGVVAQFEKYLVLFEQLEEKVPDLQDYRALTLLGPRSIAKFTGDAAGLLFWRSCLLSLLTESLPEIDEKRLEWVTINVLRLPADHLLAVAEALFERKWQTAADPFAYVSTVARRIHKRNRDHGSLSTKLRGYYRVDDFQISEVPDPTAVLDARKAEVLYDLRLALHRLRLPDDVVRLANARYDGIPDSRTAGDFGWTARQLATTSPAGVTKCRVKAFWIRRCPRWNG